MSQQAGSPSGRPSARSEPDVVVPSGRTTARSESAVEGAHTTDTATGVSWRDTALGDARAGRVANISWGAIFAGVVTFLGIVLLFSLLITALGLDGSGTGAAVVTVIALLLGFLGAGGVAGAMAVRGGLLHGFLAWATSLLATVLLLVVTTLGAASAISGVLGSLVGGLSSAAAPSLASGQLPAGVPTPNPGQTQQAQQQASQAAASASQATKTGATWGFVGLLLGAVVASVGGLLGSRSVANRKTPASAGPTR